MWNARDLMGMVETGNIALRLERHTLRRLRHLAADRNTSVSAWVSELVTEKVRELEGLQYARNQALRAMNDPVPVADAVVLSRAQAHEI
jgi:hypothetical protein